MRIGIFTPRNLKPLHPRLASFEAYFTSLGHEVTFVNESGGHGLVSRINWIFLWFVDLHAIRKCKERINEFDLIIVTDLKYLFLVRHAKRQGKLVIYDCIDHNVELRFYQISKRFRILRPFKSLIISWFRRMELGVTSKYSDSITVNSESLKDYFQDKTTLLYYNSPFESIIQSSPELPVAVLYLGAFSVEKGAIDLIVLANSLNVPLYVYGDVTQENVQDKINYAKGVFHESKLSISELRNKLKGLVTRHFLFGASLIQGVHFSYEVQEANKDIDYMAMGMPILGNYRTPTKIKIEEGCGVFYDRKDLLEIMNDTNARSEMSQNCLRHYESLFSTQVFNSRMDQIMNDLFG